MKKEHKFSAYYFLAILVFIAGMHMLFYPDVAAHRELTYNEFISNVESGKIERLVIFENRIIGEFKSDKKEKNAGGFN